MPGRPGRTSQPRSSRRWVAPKLESVGASRAASVRARGRHHSRSRGRCQRAERR